MSESVEQLAEHPDCLNCGVELQGQYCSNCGQRSSSRLISLWELIRDAFGDLFEIDSRLWRTIFPLLIRPGRLTRDYLEGRRARYMPPFRMYLVLSVLFFVVAFFNPREDLSLLFEPEPEPTAEETQELDEARAEAMEKLEELAEDGVISSEQLDEAIDEAIKVSNGQKDIKFTVVDGEFAGDEVNFEIDPDSGECTFYGHDKLPDWLQRRLTKERLQRTCERIGADDGKTLLELVLDNIPVALIVLLPFMALVLKGLYPLSRRYFVEHLLFFVHFHSFFFLMLILEIMYSRIGGLINLPEAMIVLVLVAASFYVPVYLYKAMRHVYGQGHFFTLTKYIVMLFAYFIGTTFTMLGALLFALVSV